MREQDFYRERIMEMLSQVENVTFLHQIWIIIKRHMEKYGGRHEED